MGGSRGGAETRRVEENDGKAFLGICLPSRVIERIPKSEAKFSVNLDDLMKILRVPRASV